MTKEELRRCFITRRDGLSAGQIEKFSTVIADKLYALDEYRTCRNLLIYASMRSEVMTDGIILDALKAGKNVFCPKVTDRAGGEMKFVRISDISDLHTGYFGIREPSVPDDYEEPLFDEKDSLVIMPGVAFDRCRNRIGYSGGFYDRFLECHSGLKTVAICFECQISDEEIPGEAHDIRPMKLVTENNIY